MNLNTTPNPEVRGWLRPVEVVVTASESGAFTLPDELHAARAHVTEVQAAIGRAERAAGEVTDEQTAIELAASVEVGAVPDDLGKQLVTAIRRREEARAALHVLRIVESAAAAKLRAAFESSSEAMVVEHLRPALAQMLEAASKQAPKLKGATTTDALVDVGAAGFAAWRVLIELFAGYKAIRGAYETVFNAAWTGEVGGMDPRDLRGFAAFSNYLDLPHDALGRVTSVPTQAAATMAWIVTESNGVKPEPWLPLPEELEAAQAAAFASRRGRITGEAIARQERVGAKRAQERTEQEAREQAPAEPWRGKVPS